MANIGTFKKDGDSFSGTIRSLILNTKATIVPAQAENEKAPDFHVFAGKVQIGAAWQKTSGQGATYYTVKIDDPTFPAPFFATLVEDGEEFALIWSRDSRTKKADASKDN